MVILVLLCTVSVCLFGFFGSAIGQSWLVWVGLLLPVVILLIVGKKEVEKDKAKEAERKKREELEAQREQSLKIGEKIYTRLHDDFNIASIDGTKEEEALLVVAKSFRPEISLAEAKELFNMGGAEYRKRIHQEINKKIERARKSEAEKFQAQKEDADRVGKTKYTYIAEYHEALDCVNHALRSAQEAGAREMLKSRAHKQDWATFGGLASALGGSGAGFAVASSIQQQNEKAQQTAAETRLQASAALEYYRKNPIQSQYSKSEKQLREYVESRLFCDTNVNEWFRGLEFSNILCRITEGKNFVIQGEIKCPASYTLLDRLCVLDGAVKILIRDKSKRVVAEGYFAAPGSGNMKLSEVGFYNGIIFQSLCQTIPPIDEDDIYAYFNIDEGDKYSYLENINEGEMYTYEFEPYHLWLIEV